MRSIQWIHLSRSAFIRFHTWSIGGRKHQIKVLLSLCEGGTLSVTVAARSDTNKVFPSETWNIHRNKPLYKHDAETMSYTLETGSFKLLLVSTRWIFMTTGGGRKGGSNHQLFEPDNLSRRSHTDKNCYCARNDSTFVFLFNFILLSSLRS